VTGASAAAEEQARELVYQRLDQSARDGEFERDIFRGGRAVRVSELRYLDPEVPRCRIGREQLGYVESISGVAQFCWLPRELARQWLASNGYPWPTHFDPVAQISPTVRPAPVGIRPASRGIIRTNKAEAAEEACREWIAGLTERPANKDAAFAEAQDAVKQTGPLSRKAFERAWASVVGANWKRGGRRNKNSAPQI